MQSSEFSFTNNLELLAKQVVEGFITGLHKSPFHGFSVEFAEHRLYNKGESIKHVDWKLFARTEKLFVKRYEEETNLRCCLAIDHSASMHYPKENLNKLRFSVYAAAALMNLLRKQRDAFSLCTFAEQIDQLTEAKSTSNHYRMLLRQLTELLEQKEAPKTSQLAESIDELSDRLHRRSLVIIFSDLLQDAQNTEKLMRSLQHLRYNRHEVILFHVRDKKTEELLDLGNRPHQLRDPETGEVMRVIPSEVKAGYTKAVTLFMQETKYKLTQMKVDYIPVDVALDFKQVLLSFLLKRSKLI